MKRLIFILTFLLLLSACSSPKQSDVNINVNPFFNAEVIRWDTDEVLLSPIDIPDEQIDDQFSSLNEFFIPVSTFEKHGITALDGENMVRIVCSGLQKKSDSVSLGTVFAIYLLDENGDIIID